MEDIRTLLSRAGRRLGLVAFLERLHWVALGVASLAMLIVVISKLTPDVSGAVNWVWMGPAMCAMTLVGAWTWWMTRRPSSLQVAVQVDDRLELREKLSTAMLCRGREDAFAQAAIDDAIGVARDAKTRERVTRKFVVAPPPNWWMSPAIVMLAIMATLWVPQFDLFADEPEEDKVAMVDEETIESIEAQVEESMQKVAEELGTTKEELEEALGNLGDEMNPEDRDPMTPDEAKRDAFKKLTAMQDKLRDANEAKAQTMDAMLDKLRQLELGGMDGPAADMGKALAEGDFDAAKQALEQIQNDIENGDMNEEDKQKLAEQMANLAEQLDQLSKNNAAMAEALKKAGMDPNLANMDKDAIKEALENAQNLTEQQRQQLQQMANAMQQANQNMQQMAAAAQQMAAGQAGEMGAQGAQGMQAMAGELSEMEMMSAEMASANATMSSLAGQCQGMGQGQGICQGNGQGNLANGAASMAWMQTNVGNGKGAGMGQRGQGAGGRGSRVPTKVSFRAEKEDVHTQGGPSIGSRFVEGETFIVGESNAEFTQQIQAQSSRAQDELTDNRIPARYRGVVQHYFGELDSFVKSVQSNVETPSETTPTPDTDNGQ